MQMKRVLGIGTASLILATASVFGGTAAHAGVMKASTHITRLSHSARNMCARRLLSTVSSDIGSSRRQASRFDQVKYMGSHLGLSQGARSLLFHYVGRGLLSRSAARAIRWR